MRTRAAIGKAGGWKLRERARFRFGSGVARKRGAARRSGKAAEAQPQREASGVACFFGATCVGTLLERMRLHLATQRFLAERRGDWLWEASCDYAGLSLERIGSRLRPGMFEQPLFPRPPRTQGRRRGAGRAAAFAARRGAAR